MPKASEVAHELRKLADALEVEPETDLAQPMVTFYCDTKDQFLASARLLPRPLKKEFEEVRMELANDRHECPIWLRSVIERTKVCILVKPAQPAVYDCEPLLSPDEENELGGAA